MSEADIKKLKNSLKAKPADIVPPKVFNAFMAKASTIKGCRV